MSRKLETSDLERFNMVSSPTLSPDASMIAYVVTRCLDDGYASIITVADTMEGKPLRSYSEGNPKSPTWSPDGSQLLFTSKKGIEDGKGTGVWTGNLDAGEPRLVCRAPGGAGSLTVDSGGRKAYFIGSVGEEEKDVKFIDRIPFWFNGEGWVYNRVKQLFMADIESGHVTQLTHGERDVQCYAVSGEGKLAYTVSMGPPKPSRSRLFIHDLETGVAEEQPCGFSLSTLAWSPGGDRLSFMGNDDSHGSPTHLRVYVMDPASGEVSCLTESLDLGCSRRHYYDIRSPSTGMAGQVWEGAYVFFPLSESNRFNIYRADPDGSSVKPVVEGQFSVEEFSVRGGTVAYTRVNTDKPAEIFIKKGETVKQLTHVNTALLEEVQLVPHNGFSFTQLDGSTVEGWVLKPTDWKQGESYPAILDIHGGPRSKFGDSVMFEHQLYAASGYAVIYVNIRGSDGYSQDFADMRGDWGNWDYRDLMKGVDEALEQNPWIDPSRLAVTGLSYGGFMTNWVITHTDRFKTAVSQNSISSWTSFFGTSDIGFSFTPDQIGGSPWSNMAEYLEKSPITYAGDVETPVLFVHSLNDYRCWIDQSFEFFTALKYLGKEAKLALFMEGPHAFRSSAKPSVRVRRLEVMLDWFNMYLSS